MTTNAPGRRAPRSTAATQSWAALVAAFGVSLVSLLSSDPFLHAAGLLVAGLGGVVGCLLAWREVGRVTREAQTQSVESARATTAALRAQRSQHRGVLDVLDRRLRAQGVQVHELRQANAHLTGELSTLRGNNEALRVELEMARTIEEETTAEVVTLPRRATGTGDASAVPLWTDANSPTVVDLQAIVTPFLDDAIRRDPA